MLVNEIADPLAPHRAVTADAGLHRSAHQLFPSGSRRCPGSCRRVGYLVCPNAHQGGAPTVQLRQRVGEETF